MKTILKLFGGLFGFIIEEIIVNEWKSNRWAFMAFLAPWFLVLSSLYSPLPGGTAFLAWFVLLLGVGVVRMLLPIIFRRKKVTRNGQTFLEQRGYYLEAEKCKEAASALCTGGSLAIVFLAFVFLRSPEMKEVAAKSEAKKQALIASGTLLEDAEYSSRIKPVAGVLTHNPEPRGKGRLLLIRVKLERETSPVMAFLDPTMCESPLLLKAGDAVWLKAQRFRAYSQGMYADPGMDTSLWLYFVEPECK